MAGRAVVSTGLHELTHGSKPRGAGDWWFKSPEGTLQFSHRGMYKEAKRAAVRWGTQHGYILLLVMP